MSLFPDLTAGVSESGYSVTLMHEVDMLGPTMGNVIQRAWRYAYHVITLAYEMLTDDEMRQLWEFYDARKGSWESFSMFDLRAVPRTDVGIGTHTGGSTSYTLPAKGCSRVTVKVGGVTVAHTLNSGTGTDGQDRVTIDTASTGAVTADFTGRRYFPKCIFTNQGLTRSLFAFRLHGSGVEIRTVS